MSLNCYVQNTSSGRDDNVNRFLNSVIMCFDFVINILNFHNDVF